MCDKRGNNYVTLRKFSAGLHLPVNRSFVKRPEHGTVENLYGYFRRKESRHDLRNESDDRIVAIPIEFCISNAMTAKKSAKKCTAFRVFVLIKLLLFYYFFVSFVVVVLVRVRQERCDAKQI